MTLAGRAPGIDWDLDGPSRLPVSGGRAADHGREGHLRRGRSCAAVFPIDHVETVDQRGYLIDPWASLQIDGFRRSQSAVAAFRFGAVKDSYAARKGNDRNVGVIGVAFFHERGSSLPWTARELDRRDSANPFPGSYASPPPAR